MHKFIFTLFCLTAISFASLCAQVVVAEPEFVGDVTLLVSDSVGIKLSAERTNIKAGSSTFSKIARFAPIPGASLLAKNDMHFELNGAESDIWMEQGDVRFIVRAENQDYDPRSFLRVVKFETKKKKRRAKLMSTSFLQGVEMNSESELFDIEKYGEKSFLVTLKDMKSGQYGITTTEMFFVRTFGVK